MVLGLAFAAVVDVFTKGIIGMIFGGANFAAWNVTTSNGSTIAVGSLVAAVVNFLIVALVLFFIVRDYNRAIPREAEPTGPTEVDLLTRIRDELRRR